MTDPAKPHSEPWDHMMLRSIKDQIEHLTKRLADYQTVIDKGGDEKALRPDDGSHARLMAEIEKALAGLRNALANVHTKTDSSHA